MVIVESYAKARYRASINIHKYTSTSSLKHSHDVKLLL